MYNMTSHLRTDQLTSKHGQSAQQKSNFKYLMATKTNRSARNNQKSKENQIQSVLMKQAHKFANKTFTSQIKTQDCQSLVIPLSFIQPQTQNESKQTPSLHAKSSEELKIRPDSQLKEGSSQTLCLESNINMEDLQQCSSANNGSAETGCMTDGCYYEKELEIKIQLLQKQRDDIWNRIASTLQQNIILKGQIEKYIIQKKNTYSVASQTDSMIALQTQVQTQINLQTMTQYLCQNQKNHRQILQGQRIKKQIEEAKLFCLKIVGEVQSVSEISQTNLKSCIAEAMNMKLLKIAENSQFENELKEQIHKQQIAQLKQKLENSFEKLKIAKKESRQSQKVKMNIQKLYKKQMEQIKGLLRQKQYYFENQIDRLTKQFSEMIALQQNQNKRYLDYLQSASSSWKQKQKIYSTLLSEAHKTIRSLMAQMKEFQELAYSNYSKYLLSQKIHVLNLLPKDNDQQ